MKALLVLFVSVCRSDFIVEAFSRRSCDWRPIPNADGVCVCNQTFCDDLPVLERPDAGTARVYESGKSGHRFNESIVTFETNSSNSNEAKETLIITIDKSKTYQDILGFGGAITDVTGFVLSAVPKSLSDSLMNSYFSDNGLQYNMVRVPIAGTDYSFREYSYDDTKADDMTLEHFALQEEDFKYKFPLIKHAKSLNQDLRLFASPWHCPQWMKTDMKSKEPAQLKGEMGGQYYEVWAKYLIKFLDAYESQNISFWGLTVENEPTWGRQFNSLYLNAEMEREFVKSNLGPHLHRSGYTPDKLKVMIYDDNVNYHDGRPSIQNYSETILSDNEAKKYISGIAYHWYESSRTSDYPSEILEDIHSNFPEYFTLMTEACHLEGLGNGRWDFAEHYAHDIIRDINHWAEGWVEWNMALGLNGCSKCGLNQCGSSLLIDIEKKEALKQPSFYAIGHFSKFISPDSVRVEHTSNKAIDNVFVLTVKRPDNGLVVVVLNQNNRSIDLQINESNKRLFYSITERSIQTYIWY